MNNITNDFIKAINGKCSEKILQVWLNNKYFAKYPASTARLVVDDLKRNRANVTAIDPETGEIIYY